MLKNQSPTGFGFVLKWLAKSCGVKGGGYTADLEREAHCSTAEVDFMPPALSSSFHAG